MKPGATGAPPRGSLARRAVEQGARSEFLGFRMGGELYAVSIAFVKEILRVPPLTEVPRAPADIMGVISVRGRIVTVCDLRKRLGLSTPELTRRSRILLTELPTDHGGTGERIGFFVDEVLQVYRLAEDEIEDAATALGAESFDYALGIGRQGGELIVLLDLAAAFVRSRFARRGL